MNKATMKLLCTITLAIIAVTSYGQCQWDRFKKATDETTPEGQALTEAIDQDPAIVDDWEKLDIAGVRDMQVGYGRALDKEKWLADLKVGVYRNGDKAEYVNPNGNLLSWTEQHPNSFDIQSFLPPNGQIVTTGKEAEAVVADFIQKEGKEIKGFGLGVSNRTANNPAGDIDVLTENEIIEVKKSYSSFKKGQLDKFTNSSLPNYLNPYSKKAILYIHETLTDLQKSSILGKLPDNVTLVNSLEELKSILQ